MKHISEFLPPLDKFYVEPDEIQPEWEWVRLDATLSSISTDENNSDLYIKCPICDCLNCHVETRKFNGNKTIWGKYGGKDIILSCESRHYFKIDFNDHKGNVFPEIYGLKRKENEI